MADVVVTVTLSSVSYTTWLRTSLIGASKVANGVPMIEITEFGPDQEDAFVDFTYEASREVLKLFTGRQGDVNGLPFEATTTEITYRFNEEQPPLPQATAIKDALYLDVKNAIYTYIALLWFKIKNNEEMVSYFQERYEKLASNINTSLFKLHD